MLVGVQTQKLEFLGKLISQLGESRRPQKNKDKKSCHHRFHGHKELPQLTLYCLPLCWGHHWHLESQNSCPLSLSHKAIVGNTKEVPQHDYYSIWFNFTANFIISEEKV
jgi:hypothetical protein